MYREYRIVHIQFDLLCDQRNISELEFAGYIIWCISLFNCIANFLGISVSGCICYDQCPYISGFSSFGFYTIDEGDRSDDCIFDLNCADVGLLTGYMETLF